MGRFILDEEIIKTLSAELPDLDEVGLSVMKLAPDLISIRYPRCNIPIAAVCLRDTLSVLLQVRIGLNESFQHKVWYREICDPPNEQLAVIFMQFYLDGMVSRLYAASEHIANSIIFILNITDDQLNEYRKGRSSQQSIVGHYLTKELPEHTITKSVLTLATNHDWKRTMNYRNNIIHDQPPTVSGLGTVYKRKNRWFHSENDKALKLELGGGDEPDYTIDDLLSFVHPAIFRLVDLFRDIVGFYISLLAEQGIHLTDQGLSVNIFKR